jgi:hypothetical protein
MPEYRLYCLNDRGRFAKAHEFTAQDDSDALEKAKTLKAGVDCELWNRDRLIAKLRPDA